MAPMALGLILGWCLVAASRAWHVPQPSLLLHPSQGVSLGDTVTLQCHLPRLAAWVKFYQEGHLISYKYPGKEQDRAEFSLVDIKQEAAVRYWCQYELLYTARTSETSEPVELVVTDHRFSPPEISLSPEKYVETGTNITIRCWNQDYQGIFLLHKDGCSAPIQHQDPDGGGTATFTLFGVTPADNGSYRCSYRAKAYPLVSSPLGDRVILVVRPTHAPPDAGVPPRQPEAVQFQVPPGDSEGLTYAELHAVNAGPWLSGLPAAPQPAVIYAEVGTAGPH
ncbi:platelet glycoprotein VI-like isoform X2 [Numida meleagris]|uniref:platelet glycoprotein VI-like isoform X2 n=1 Tax=Numida meleagris TaxID=8996 RepID=UPI000B3DC75F|nr:platelet glycoprotein VI-like isoform X2 [Numida meleagris]